MKKQRKHYSPEEKAAILRRHLLEKEPISKLCDELGLQPTVFYRWQNEFFENGLQRVHSDFGNDACPDLAVSPAIGWKDRTVAQIAQRGVHRPGTPLSLDDARRLVSGYVDDYNNTRLNNATGYITPKDMLVERQQEIQAERDRKLAATRRQRQIRRQQAA